MYIPKIKQIAGGKVAGKLLDIKTGLQYFGKFVKDYKGNFFKGSQITSKSEPLLYVPDVKAIERELNLQTVFRSPSEQEYTKGSFTRYFVKDSRTGRVVEVDEPQYLQQRKTNKLYRRALKIEWYITGEPEDQIINGYLYPGTKSKNQDVIKQAEEILPGIGEQILKDPGQCVK